MGLGLGLGSHELRLRHTLGMYRGSSSPILSSNLISVILLSLAQRIMITILTQSMLVFSVSSLVVVSWSSTCFARNRVKKSFIIYCVCDFVVLSNPTCDIFQ